MPTTPKARKRTPRPKLGDAQLSHVLDIAEEEFAAYGFDDASFNQIIARAGISKGSMYYRFQDKADLFAAVLARAAEALARVAGPWQPAADADGYRQQMRALALRVYEAATEDPAFERVVRIAARVPDALGRLTPAQQRAALAWAVAVLRDGQRVGAVRADLPVDFLAHAALGLGQAMDRWMLLHLGDTPPDQMHVILDGALDVYLRALSAPANGP